MNISEPFIHRPIATALLMMAIGFVGLVAVPFLPVAPLPQVDFPTIAVTATLQGASAETMAASVAAPLERHFGQIPGVVQLTSVSTINATSITIQFNLNRNIDSAGQDVQAAITVAGKTLPQQMSIPPSYKKVNPADSPVLILAAQSDTLPLIHPFTILSTLPSAGVGALLALSTGSMDLSVISIIGIILLIGIVQKNGIMLVDFAIVAERERNLPPIAAIREACLLRFRPILMTTAAALLAGLPMAFAHGTGAELRLPLGYSMVGGLALSQVLTLYTTPVVYLYLARLQVWMLARGAGPEFVRSTVARDIPHRSIG